MASYIVPRPRERFDHVGGIAVTLNALRELVEWPLSRRSLYTHLGVDPPRGILLHGPSGCGKTLLANAVGGELGVPFLRLSAPEIVSGLSGESERKLRNVFQEAVKMQPSIVFIDEIDAIASSREGATKDMERRIVSQLLSCIDSLSVPQTVASSKEKSHKSAVSAGKGNSDVDADTQNVPVVTEVDRVEEGTETGFHSIGQTGGSELEESMKPESEHKLELPPAVVVIAATNRPESLEPALRRAGRFDKEIELGAPDENGRRAILEKLSRELRLDSSFNLNTVTKRTAGYVGADLHLLVKEAGLACIRRVVKQELDHHTTGDSEAKVKDVDMDDYLDADNDATVEDESAHLAAMAEAEDTGISLDLDEEDSEDERDILNGATHSRSEGTEHRGSGMLEETQGLSSIARSASISMQDFEDALQRTQPSAMREGFTTRPNVSWDKVGSLEEVREEMIMAIVEPIRRPEIFTSLGLHAAGGVLLYGPPGCGKTLLARAVASESGANFIAVKGPELLSKYVGDSELAVRKLFARARCSAPCVIFFDELDALAPRRGGGGSGGERESSGASERVVNMLLTEMDGFNERKQVFLIAATNRPDIIDPAMLRPGRLDKLVFVPLPDANGRVSILETLLKGVKISEEVDVSAIAKDERCDGFSGADMQALIRVAGESALREIVFGGAAVKKVADPSAVRIEKRHFEKALASVMPSVSSRDAKSYQGMEKRLRKSRGHVRGEDPKK